MKVKPFIVGAARGHIRHRSNTIERQDVNTPDNGRCGGWPNDGVTLWTILGENFGHRRRYLPAGAASALWVCRPRGGRVPENEELLCPPVNRLCCSHCGRRPSVTTVCQGRRRLQAAGTFQTAFHCFGTEVSRQSLGLSADCLLVSAVTEIDVLCSWFLMGILLFLSFQSVNLFFMSRWLETKMPLPRNIWLQLTWSNISKTSNFMPHRWRQVMGTVLCLQFVPHNDLTTVLVRQPSKLFIKSFIAFLILVSHYVRQGKF